MQRVREPCPAGPDSPKPASGSVPPPPDDGGATVTRVPRLSSGVAVDVLVQGREPERPPRNRPRLRGARALAVLLAVTAGIAAAAVHLETDHTDPQPEPSEPQPLPPLPRVLLTRAEVAGGEQGTEGTLRLRVRLEGVPRAQLLSLRAELPGSAVVLSPLPDRLSAAGVAEVRMDVLPTCPEALPGLSQAAVVAAVRGRERSAVRLVRVRLDTAGLLAEAVRDRCGPVAGAPALRASLVELAEPTAADALATRVELAPAGPAAVTVVAVRPGPGLAVDVGTPLPLVLEPSSPPTPLRVDLRPGGCGGAPDTPPYVLVLADGQSVALSVATSARPRLDALRPYVCPG